MRSCICYTQTHTHTHTYTYTHTHTHKHTNTHTHTNTPYTPTHKRCSFRSVTALRLPACLTVKLKLSAGDFSHDLTVCVSERKGECVSVGVCVCVCLRACVHMCVEVVKESRQKFRKNGLFLSWNSQFRFLFQLLKNALSALFGENAVLWIYWTAKNTVQKTPLPSSPPPHLLAVSIRTGEHWFIAQFCLWDVKHRRKTCEMLFCSRV